MALKYLIICLAAFFASGLTLFSGFGLGTLLLPVMAVFFPVGLAVALTAVVHLFNNLFKLALLGRHADKGAVLRFGLPAILASFLGAWTLLWLAGLKPVFRYHLGGREFQVMPVNFVVAVLIAIFVVLELWPKFQQVSFAKKYLPVGGLLSGFFGGLSGFQGALRSAFLIKAGLTKEGFIATGVVIAVLVDGARLVVYGLSFSAAGLSGSRDLLAAAILAAFAGAYLGSRLLQKVTLRGLQILVALMLLGIALALGAGII